MFPVVATLLIPTLSASFLFYIYLTLVPSAKTQFLIPKGFFEPSAQSPNGKKNVLLVVAHPDDECMFFGPTVLQLSQQENVLVRAVSLSNGNFDGLGSIREKEFVESCRALGIERDHAVVLDNGKMQDGMNVWWKEEDVAEVVRKIVETHPIDTIITFDKYGISGHPNHRALYTGVKHLLLQTHKIPRNLKAYSLVSVPLLRKFISLLDLFPTFLMHFRHTIRNRKVLLEAENMEQVRTMLKSNLRKDRILFLSSPADVWQARKAMTCHKSQMVWFRHLYLVFSRYMVMNELEEI